MFPRNIAITLVYVQWLSKRNSDCHSSNKQIGRGEGGGTTKVEPFTVASLFRERIDVQYALYVMLFMLFFSQIFHLALLHKYYAISYGAYDPSTDNSGWVLFDQSRPPQVSFKSKS